jgi:hypothetical protein
MVTPGAHPPALRLLRIADSPAAWRNLGFMVRDDGLEFDGVRVELVKAGRGILAWGLSGIDPVESIDGLVTEVAEPGHPPPSQADRPRRSPHDNGAVAIDHVVVTSPDFDRTAAALARAGVELRRVRELGGGGRQGFRRLGPTILELVEAPSADRAQSARFWGLVVVVPDLRALAERLGPQLGQIKPAIQPGREIATLRDTAGLSPAVAFMTPE